MFNISARDKGEFLILPRITTSSIKQVTLKIWGHILGSGWTEGIGSFGLDISTPQTDAQTHVIGRIIFGDGKIPNDIVTWLLPIKVMGYTTWDHLASLKGPMSELDMNCFFSYLCHPHQERILIFMCFTWAASRLEHHQLVSTRTGSPSAAARAWPHRCVMSQILYI